MSLLRLMLGRSLRSDEQEEAKIGVAEGFPALGLDGLSSSAYGPEAALTLLLPLGAAGIHYILLVTGAILFLLGLLYFSYRQTIAAYPRQRRVLQRWPRKISAFRRVCSQRQR